MVDEPINFDLTPEPETPVQPPVAPEGEAASAAYQLPPLPPGTVAPDTPGPHTTRPSLHHGAALTDGATRALPPIPDFRAAAHPFAMQSRFQIATARTPVSARQRLLYGILAAIVSVIVVIAIVLALQAFDHTQRG